MPTHGKYQIDSTNTNLQFHCYQFVTISQPTCRIDSTNQRTHLNMQIDIFWTQWICPYRQHCPTLWRVSQNLQLHWYHFVCAGRPPCEHFIPTLTYKLTWLNWLYPPKPTSSLLPVCSYLKWGVWVWIAKNVMIVWCLDLLKTDHVWVSNLAKMRGDTLNPESYETSRGLFSCLSCIVQYN
jgi:hypothetical protein